MKKLIILLCLIFPLGAFAQDVKIAYVKTQEIFLALPEVATMRTQLEDLNKKYEQELTQMQEEYNNKYSAFVAQQDSLPENIRLRRMQEIEDIRQRVENFIPAAQQDVQNQQQTLFQPIQEKVQRAITSVGDEKGYTCVLEPEVLLYIGSSAIDATPFVKAKLGLQ